ncbi:putative GNAT family N-acyltransferase [Bacillus ectoiniformans]|uniref:GNAT family N-acetyltransferase n=1 Tax=Bacillus ectoiniformans TaxID=1494429 RepID=UPI00195654D3|nr:GNAT family N-acetyltransferase [Bacillus ectoiniformans]MBM7647514.1 putative GNAT family N-acyltransferase [Bacillus ectoiniformans]
MPLEVKIVQNQQELNDAFTVRKKVFVEEQQVPLELEIDEHEDSSAHFTLYDGEMPCGAGRFREVEGVGKAERICILPEYRGTGAGRQMMEAIESYAKSHSLPAVKLNAQTQAIPFYERIGYEIISDEFLDAGIPHKTMKKQWSN